MKRCFKCGIEKPYSDFSKYPKMKDGYRGKCKECTSVDRNEARAIKRQDPEYVKREREVKRVQYERIKHRYTGEYRSAGKKEYMKKYKAMFPEMRLANAACNQLPSPEKGYERHHWNYGKLFRKDIILIKSSVHKILHKRMTYEQSVFMFRDLEGNLLDTKEKHEAYIKKVELSYFSGM